MPNDMEAYAESRAAPSPAATPEAPAAPSPSPAAPAPAQEPANSGAADTPAREPAAAPAEPKPPLTDAQRQQRYRRSVQARFDEMTRDNHELKRQNGLLIDQTRELMQRIGGGQQERAEPQQRPAGREPREEDYPNDYRAFLRAEAQYAADQKLAEWERKQQESRQQEQQQTQQREAVERVRQVATDFASRTEEYANATPSYDADIESLQDVQIGQHNAAMVQTIMLRRDSAKILHALSTPEGIEVAHRISELPPALQGAAIGEFAAAIPRERARAPQVSNAPTPGRPVGAGRAPVTGSPPDDMDSYAAWRHRQT